MRISLISVILLPIIFISCGDSNQKQLELELKEKELALKEKELELQKAKRKSEIIDNAQGSKSNNVQATPKQKAISKEKTKEELQDELRSIESSNSSKYIDLNYTYKVNLAANTIVEGTVSNKASIARFKNVKVRITFYSKTDAALGSEIFTIMEFLPAGRSKSFRHRIDGWWKGNSYAKYTILSAEPY